jgi:heme/copper-type cytochrome/quinol oxidase subunit 2
LFLEAQRFHHSTNFEFLCASFPSIIILLILIPSTLLLYSLDEDLEPLLTYKVLGHQ